MDSLFLKATTPLFAYIVMMKLKYDRSTSSLSYHLRTKHAFVSGTNVAHSSTFQPSLSEMLEQARCDSISNSIAKWIATNSRPINIVEDDGWLLFVWHLGIKRTIYHHEALLTSV